MITMEDPVERGSGKHVNIRGTVEVKPARNLQGEEVTFTGAFNETGTVSSFGFPLGEGEILRGGDADGAGLITVFLTSEPHKPAGCTIYDSAPVLGGFVINKDNVQMDWVITGTVTSYTYGRDNITKLVLTSANIAKLNGDWTISVNGTTGNFTKRIGDLDVATETGTVYGRVKTPFDYVSNQLTEIVT